MKAEKELKKAAVDILKHIERKGENSEIRKILSKLTIPEAMIVGSLLTSKQMEPEVQKALVDSQRTWDFPKSR